MRCLNGRFFIWVCLVFCFLHPVAVYADTWEVYIPDEQTDELSYQTFLQPAALETVDEDTEDEEYFEDEIELINDLATDSDWQSAQTVSASAVRIATRSNAVYVQNDGNDNSGIMLLSSYAPYDSSMSSSVVAYYDDVLPKLGNVHYVLFRSGQYDYRLVYSDDLQYSDGVFSADLVQYVAYNTRYYTWAQGTEDSFVLDAGSYLVYSDLGDYPMLSAESVYQWFLILLGAIYLLFIIYRSMLAPRRMRI